MIIGWGCGWKQEQNCRTLGISLCSMSHPEAIQNQWLYIQWKEALQSKSKIKGTQSFLGIYLSNVPYMELGYFPHLQDQALTSVLPKYRQNLECWFLLMINTSAQPVLVNTELCKIVQCSLNGNQAEGTCQWQSKVSRLQVLCSVCMDFSFLWVSA